MYEEKLGGKKSQQQKLEEEREKYKQLWMMEEGVSSRLRQEVTDLEKKLESMKKEVSER